MTIKGFCDPEYGVTLSPEELPTKWYNIVPDLPEPLPPMLNPHTFEPVKRSEMEQLFPKEIVRQQFSDERFFNIPEEVLDAYRRLPRPTPLIRARRLEKFLKTPAKIFFKAEHVTPVGSMKPNTALPQSYYAMKEGVQLAVSETGAGQWGSALAMSCSFFGLPSLIYMVRVSARQKPGRKIMMETYGSKVVESPSSNTKVGRELLKENPEHPGSLGIAISEAVETVIHNPDAKYLLASSFNYALAHQTIIGLEVRKQLEMLDLKPDVMCGAIGGGSNYSGFIYPILREQIRGEKFTDFVAVESAAVPSTTKGQYTYDYADTSELTPLVKMYTVGHKFANPPIHAGGLRYHGKAPSLSLLINKGLVRSVSYTQNKVFEAARIFSQTEGIITAPESAHGLRYAIDEALRCKKTGEAKTIIFNNCGHGLLDLSAYGEYNAGSLQDWEPDHVEVPQYVAGHK
ncbi:MAG TPA: TrpB-like pyridoxal phosphate-dependent enzyme [Thermoplasmataceae archaeon]|nr:TrpB-like pyridoxal phosphate-dependent enzyme [Thermoplasmatales archaeon AK]HLH86368.1 TrpB-like pyridoxal phosphate-dependent enzyme [Thermoplasmataceae archaeon]